MTSAVAGAFFLGAAVMATEVVMTRVFSSIIWYHFAFFAISVALFGAGVAGVVVHRFASALSDERAEAHVAWAGAGLAVSVVVAAVALARWVPSWFDAVFARPSALSLAPVTAVFVIASAPFFAGGYAMSLLLARRASRIDALYAADLAGGATGATLSVPLLSALGGTGALIGAALLGALATLAFAWPSKRRGAPLAAVAAVAAGALLSSSHALDAVRAKGFDLRAKAPEFDRWNAFSRVTVFGDAPFAGWGVSPAYRGSLPEQKAVFIDMAAFTPLSRFGGDLRAAEHTRFDLSAFAYRVHPRLRRACVIGAGGGKDVLAALAAGAERVTAAEINPLIVHDVVGGQFREFAGDLYRRPDVSMHVEDGRSLLRSTAERFDVVLISMVDTSAASTAGAFALTENSLYTVEAFTDFMDRLEPGGILSVSSVSMTNLVLGARLVSVAREALARRGADPSQSLAVLETFWLGGAGGVGGVMHNLLVSRDGFSPEVTASVRSNAQALGFFVAYVPGQGAPARDGEGESIYRIATEPDPRALEAYISQQPFDLAPSTDERPYFFYQDRLSGFLGALVRPSAGHSVGQGLNVLSKVFAVTLALVFLCLLAPAALARRRATAGAGSAARDVAYVSCLGLGFLFVEMALIQRMALYLGQPVYSLAVVLSTLLLSSGAGARFLPRRLVAGPLRLSGLLVLTVFVAAVAGACVQPVLDAALGARPVVRAVACAALIAPVGFLLGAPFPAGLAAVARRAPDRIPWLWAVNAAMSVLGSVLATIVSLHAGLFATFGTGLVAYAVAAALSVGLVR